STSSPVARPIMSAPGPRAGSSGRYGRSGSSPNVMRTASPMSVPGNDPIPVAAPAGHGSSMVTGSDCTGSRPAGRGRSGPAPAPLGSGGGGDGGGAQDDVAGRVGAVGDHGLAGGHAAGGPVQAGEQPVAG